MMTQSAKTAEATVEKIDSTYSNLRAGGVNNADILYRAPMTFIYVSVRAIEDTAEPVQSSSVSVRELGKMVPDFVSLVEDI